MPHNQILLETSYTNHILENLNQVINEAILVRKIVRLSDQLRGIEVKPEQADRTRFIRDEIADLEAQLSEIRSKANR